MHIELERTLLFEALSRTTPIAERKTTLPILSHVLLNAESGRISLTATDLEVGLRMFVEGEVKTPGVIALPAKKMHDIARELPMGTIGLLTEDGNRVKIQSGMTLFELSLMDPTDYPAWTVAEDTDMTPVSAEKLSYMIDKTLFASSSDDSRFNLNGILFEPREDGTRLVATDGHRLAKIEEELKLPISSKILVPKKSLLELKRILETLDGDVELGFDSKNIIVRTDRFVMSLRLIDGEYPDYEKVIPKSGDTFLTVQRLDLIQTLRRVSVLVSERNKGVTIKAAEGTLELSTTHVDYGTAKDSAVIGYNGEPFELIVNGAYLMEALTVLDSESLRVEYHEEGAPLVLKPDPPKSYFNLVMPMRK